MAINFELFIGRENEIKQLEELLRDRNAKRKKIVFLYDATQVKEKKGGIGKTWLLNRFKSIAKQKEFKDNYIVIDEILVELMEYDKTSPTSISVAFTS